jgi:serine/threonine protein kinase
VVAADEKWREIFMPEAPAPSVFDVVLNTLDPDVRAQYCVASRFPVTDELGRLMCKSCGQPSQSFKIKDVPATAGAFARACLTCRKMSLYSGEEVSVRHYAPALDVPLHSEPKSSRDPVASATGHLLCAHCGTAQQGFSVLGTRALTDQSAQHVVWIACEQCHEITSYDDESLRTALTQESVEELRVGETLLGFEILSVLEGGMSTVYICKAPFGIVAAKTLRPEFARYHVYESRFARESEVWVRLGIHPNIVPALLVGEQRSRYFIVTEYQPHGTLAGLLQRGSLHVRMALSFAADLCRGMIQARTIIPDLVHRDLKPSNCFLGFEGQLRIADFGLARLTAAGGAGEAKPSSGRSASTGVFATALGAGGLGTLPYMPPEQFGDFAAVDTRGDIYAFGIVLFEMLTGELLIVADDPESEESWQHAHAHGRRRSLPEELNFARELEELIAACTHPNPERRPSSFELVLQAIENITAPKGQRELPRAGVDDLEALDMFRVFNLINIRRITDASSYADRIIAVASSSEHPEAPRFHGRGLAFKALIAKQIGDVKALLRWGEQAIEVFPDEALALMLLGWAHNHRGDPGRALTFLEKSHRLDPERPGLAFELGFAYNATQKFDLALDVLVPAAGHEPDNALLMREIAYSYLASARPRRAIEWYERAIALRGDDNPAEVAELCANLASANYQVGDQETGNRWLLRAWHIAPEGSSVRQAIAPMISKK